MKEPSSAVTPARKPSGNTPRLDVVFSIRPSDGVPASGETLVPIPRDVILALYGPASVEFRGPLVTPEQCLEYVNGLLERCEPVGRWTVGLAEGDYSLWDEATKRWKRGNGALLDLLADDQPYPGAAAGYPAKDGVRCYVSVNLDG